MGQFEPEPVSICCMHMTTWCLASLLLCTEHEGLTQWSGCALDYLPQDLLRTDDAQQLWAYVAAETRDTRRSSCV